MNVIEIKKEGIFRYYKNFKNAVSLYDYMGNSEVKTIEIPKFIRKKIVANIAEGCFMDQKILKGL